MEVPCQWRLQHCRSPQSIASGVVDPVAIAPHDALRFDMFSYLLLDKLNSCLISPHVFCEFATFCTSILVLEFCRKKTFKPRSVWAPRDQLSQSLEEAEPRQNHVVPPLGFESKTVHLPRPPCILEMLQCSSQRVCHSSFKSFNFKVIDTPVLWYLRTPILMRL